MKIRILSDEMASRIAAGEVVERPASVVKELVENSLDAGATEVSVGVEKGGASLIRVTDNGSGMEPQDLALAVERHATSKLAEDADLFRIATLGFRGEALPSIGAVAELEIVSRPPGAPSAYRVHVAGGKKAGPFPAAAAAGTTIEVREIFFNTPARKKFLKSPATELSHICDVVNRLALAYPRVHFRLQHDGRTLADYAAVGDGKDRLYQVFGPDIAKGLKPFHGRRGELSAHGYLTSAPVSFPNARHLYTFVNRRYVRDKVLTHAVLYGYETLLMKGQYPAAVLFVDLPFEQVDVNVHPAKLEVRFRRQSDVHEAVSSAVRDALKIEATKPAAGAQTTAMPLGVHEETLPYGDAATVRTDLGWPATQVAASPSAAAERRQGFFSSLHVLGQVLGCYLVCVSPKGLVLIDQHAAHERVAFEKLRRQLDSGKVERQNLLLPQSVELNGGEMMLLAGRIEVLERFGFALEPFGPNAYAIKSAPALLPEGDYTQLVRQMVAELAEVDTSARLRQRLEERLATIACHSVIRANRKLEMDEIHALLGDLDQIEFATQCPHGRPVVIEFSRDQLDRLFKRLV